MHAVGSSSRVPICIQLQKSDWHSEQVNQSSRVYPASKRVYASLLFLLCFAPIRLVAQTPVSSRKLIHGDIVTSEGKPVADALVEIRDLRGLQMGRGFTDGAGGFAISAPAETGEYVVFAAKASQIKDERIILNRPDIEITIAFPPALEDAAPEPPQQTVSAAQLSVPTRAWKHLQLADDQFRRRNLREAALEIDRVLQLDPVCASAFTMRAFVRLAEKNPTGALEDAKRAIVLDPHAAESFVALAMAYNALKEFPIATEAASHALGLRPDSFQARLELAKGFFGQGHLILALRELELVGIDFPDVHLVRGKVLMGLDRNSEGVDELKIFLKEAPFDSRNDRIRDIIAAAQNSVSPAGRE